MKFWTSEYTFDHPWEKVAQAAWRKYPNPMNPSVTAIDVLNRKVEKGVLYTERLISSIWGMPFWVHSVSWLSPPKQLTEQIMGSPNIMYANEKSEVDPDQKTMTLKTRNITFCKYIAVDETLVYQPHPEEPQKTLLKQEAVVLVQGVPLSSYMETMLTTTISSNAGKGRMAMEWVLKRINDEIKDLQTTAVKNTDDFLNQTKRSIDDITVTAKKSMDDFSSVAKKSIDELQYKLPAAPPSQPTIPKI